MKIFKNYILFKFYFIKGANNIIYIFRVKLLVAMWFHSTAFQLLQIYLFLHRGPRLLL